MADIDIVPKERSYTWLWIVLALVILGVLWYVLAGRGDQPAGVPGSYLAPQPEVVPVSASTLAT